MSGPYDATHKNFMARVKAYAAAQPYVSSGPWPARYLALLSNASWQTLITIRSADDYVSQELKRRAERAAWITEFGSMVSYSYGQSKLFPIIGRKADLVTHTGPENMGTIKVVKRRRPRA